MGRFERLMSCREKEDRVIRKTRMIPRLRLLSVLTISVLTLAGCGKGEGNTPPKKELTPLLVTSEDVLSVSSNTLASGPSITGSVQPERRADLRAEVSAVVLSVHKENGDPVKRGDLLVRLDQTSIRDTLTSAESSLTAASQAFEQAERQFQRMKKLRESGLVSAEQVEDVEIRRNSAQSESAAARTRMVVARQGLERTEVRAPFDGIVSDRKVSAGDTAQIGKELLKVIDPSSLRFEGLVSADSIGEVRKGQTVWFRIHGFADREFTGKVTRVNPAANVTTRQVEVLVSFDDAKQQPNVAGLYAEGHVETRASSKLSLPNAAVIREGDKAYAWSIKDAKLRKAELKLGERDPRTGSFVVQSGLNEGDEVLRFPNAALQEEQPVRIDGGSKPVAVVEK
jgi:RND family efflux transporter MFP subunit